MCNKLDFIKNRREKIFLTVVCTLVLTGNLVNKHN